VNNQNTPLKEEIGSAKLDFDKGAFIAINYITCKGHYKPRFEELFKTRAGAIDKMPGFLSMHVLKPSDNDGDYLIVSYWTNEEAFTGWT
jgi:heme-degrading monooxygenase HmoA